MWWIIVFDVAFIATKFLVHWIAAGQNLAWKYGPKVKSLKNYTSEQIEMWFSEYVNASMSIIDSFHEPPQWASLFILIFIC